MILIALGTQAFPFDRLLMEMDRLVETGAVADEVIAQTGRSPYVPRHYQSRAFVPAPEFDALLDACDILVAHGGTGTLVGGLSRGKPVVAVPRRACHGEHIDDHQLEIVGAFAESGMVLQVREMEGLLDAIERARGFHPPPFVSGKRYIIETLEAFLQAL